MRRRPRVRAGRRPLVPIDDVRRRQGPGADPLHRGADLLRGRRRVHRREAQPRLRPPDLRLGHRPPRVHRADPRRRGGDGLRPGARRDAAHRLGLDPARRAGRGDVEAGRRHLPAGHPARRDRQRRRALVLRLTRHQPRHRGRRRAGPPPVLGEPRLLRPVRARAHRVDAAQGGRGGPVARAGRVRARSRASPRRCSSGRSPGSPRSSRTPSRRRRPRASPPTRPSSRRSSTPSTATRGWSIPTSRSGPRSGSPWRWPRRRPSRTRSGCSGSRRRSRCSGAVASPPGRGRSRACSASRPRCVESSTTRFVAGIRADALRPAPCELPDHAGERRVELGRVGVGVPDRVEHDGRLAVRPLEERDAIAAPARGRGVGGRLVHARDVAQDDPELELAERVLQ